MSAIDSSKLFTQPLNLLENFSSQKCLLPVSIFENDAAEDLMPGTWAKCVLENGSYSVCRVYPRDFIQSCYLDNCVASEDFKTDGKLRLFQFECLSEVEESAPPVSEVTLVFTLTEALLRKKGLTKVKLLEMAKILLKPLTLVPGCSIQNRDLLNRGVVAIKIANVIGCADDQCFTITTETSLKIDDVCLEQMKPSLTSFHLCSFEKPWLELNDLLTIATNPQRPKGLPLNALVTGAIGSGKSSLVQNFIYLSGSNCFHITAAKVLGQYAGETESELRQIFQSALFFSEQMKPNSPTVILLEDLHLLCPSVKMGASDSGNILRISSQLLTLIDDLKSFNSNIICLATTNAPELLNEQTRRAGRFEHEITVSAPTELQRRQLFSLIFKEQIPQISLNDDDDDGILNLVAQQTQGYLVADLALLIRSISQQLLLYPDVDLSEIIKDALQRSQPSTVRNTDVSVYKIATGFESIGGMETLKRTLSVAVLAGLEHQAAFARFGLTLPKGVLLYGPPGCAKTTVAKCLAKEANMTFIATSGAEVYSPYVGCAEKFIAKMFDTARKNTPCLIFLDEIDSLVGRRSVSAGSGSGDVQLRILSTLLTEMDGIVTTSKSSESAALQHILVVAATNRPDLVDDALMRPGRFDKLIHVPAPDIESRLAILKLHSQRMPFAANVSLNEIAERTLNYSGADLCNLCNEAAMHTFQRDLDVLEIDAMDFEAILQTHKSSLTQQQIDWYHQFERKFFR